MDSFQDHVRELRNRMFKIVAALFIASAVSFYFSSDILKWLQNDLAVQVYALKAFEVFYTELMIAIILGFS